MTGTLAIANVANKSTQSGYEILGILSEFYGGYILRLCFGQS